MALSDMRARQRAVLALKVLYIGSTLDLDAPGAWSHQMHGSSQELKRSARSREQPRWWLGFACEVQMLNRLLPGR